MRIAAPTAARMLLRSCLLLLCLPRAAAVCPAGWSESPAGGCYRLTDERRNTLGVRRALRCGRPRRLHQLGGGERVRFHGAFQRVDGRGSASIKRRAPRSPMAAGATARMERPSTLQTGTMTEPNEFGVEDCAAMRGEWHDSPCHRMIPCLCERGAATSSPEYLSAISAMEAQIARPPARGPCSPSPSSSPSSGYCPASSTLPHAASPAPATPRPRPPPLPRRRTRSATSRPLRWALEASFVGRRRWHPPPASWRRRRRTGRCARASRARPFMWATCSSSSAGRQLLLLFLA